MISHTSWGGDECTLSAKTNHQKIIDTTINTIRLAIGAFRSSPIESIRNLALKPPTQLRQIEKSLIYAASIIRNTDNPTNKYKNENIKYAKEHDLELNSIIKVQPYNFLPWTTKFDINLELTKFKKNTLSQYIQKQLQ